MTVYLVGAGPGDPGLITARGLDLVRSCDVLIHDRLVAPELVAEAPHHARVISRDGLDQAAVNELLVGYGRADLDVVRLKGGDPLVFGRGGEEALALTAAGVATEIVPGVSSIAAVPAAAGIPITHRGISDRVTIASCHGADGSDAEYAQLAAAGGTLILFMGLGRVERVVEGLLAAGLAPETPAAAISRGTLPDQAVAKTTLRHLASATTWLASPTLLLIGDVAALELLAPQDFADDMAGIGRERRVRVPVVGELDEGDGQRPAATSSPRRLIHAQLGAEDPPRVGGE